jgi:phosphatidylglycerophosphate synthase
VIFSKTEYKQCTKEFRLEEPFDFLIYRPLAYIIVKLTYFLPLTPNHFSLLSFLSALIGAYYLSLGEKWAFTIAGFCVVLFSVFDCCDGMVARMKKNGSKWGMQIDMLVDLLSNVALYISLFIGLRHQNYPYPIEYFSVLCALCIFFHANVYQYYKKQYHYYIDNNPGGRLREIEYFRREYELAKKESGHYTDKILLKLFLIYSDLIKKEDKPIIYKVDKYPQYNLPILPLWGIIAGSSHLTFLALALILNEMPIYLYFALVVSNLWLVLVYIIQKSINTSILINKQAR